MTPIGLRTLCVWGRLKTPLLLSSKHHVSLWTSLTKMSVSWIAALGRTWRLVILLRDFACGSLGTRLSLSILSSLRLLNSATRDAPVLEPLASLDAERLPLVTEPSVADF